MNLTTAELSLTKTSKAKKIRLESLPSIMSQFGRILMIRMMKMTTICFSREPRAQKRLKMEKTQLWRYASKKRLLWTI